MPEKLKASEKGRELIKAAISKNSCMNRNSYDLLEEAENLLKEKGLKRKGNSRKSTWDRFKSGQTIESSTFQAFCQVLELDWEDLVESSYDNPYGLNEKCISRDFFSDYGSPRVIDQLWSDPTANGYIKVHTKRENNNNFYLRIQFSRLNGGCNFTIRPINDSPIDGSKFKYFEFKLRSPNQKLIGVRLRIIDKNCVEWLYGKISLISEKKGLSSCSDSWSNNIKIKLDPDYWKHFPFDGYRQKGEINFSKIYLISFEVGCEPNNEISNDLYGFLPNEEEEELHLSSIIFE